MTEAEKQEIVGLVMTQISSQAVDFDIATEEPQANDLLTAVRQTSSGVYEGVTLKWNDVARIATELANQAATRAEQAKTNVENMKSSVEQTVTDFNALAEEKKQEVQGVYQNDLDELKGDLENQILNEKTNRENSINKLKTDLETERNARIEADTDHSTRLQKVELASSVNRYEIDNLKAKAEGKLYRTETVEAEAYTVDVPSSVAPYAEVQRIGGKSVVWNQILHNGNFDGTNYWRGRASILSASENELTCETNGGYAGFVAIEGEATVITGHKYYSSIDVKTDEGIKLYWPYYDESVIYNPTRHISTGNYDHMSNISVAKIDGSSLFGIRIVSDMIVYVTIKAKNAMMIDLTQMFGAGNEPTLEECQKIFSADYYPYNAGEIKSFPIKKVKSVGKNKFSNEYNLGGTIGSEDGNNGVSNSKCARIEYVYLKKGNYTLSNFNANGVDRAIAVLYDISKRYVSNIDSWGWKSFPYTFNVTENGYVRFMVSRTDDDRDIIDTDLSGLQIEYGSVATDYSPYKEIEYDVSSLTEGFKSAGTAHDEWSNGKKIIRVGERAYTSGDESDSSLITDGTTTYYPLATPIEETVPEIDNYINVEGGGTLTFESDDTVHMPVPSTDRFVVDLTSTTEETT